MDFLTAKIYLEDNRFIFINLKFLYELEVHDSL